jgi:hypothetical protein
MTLDTLFLVLIPTYLVLVAYGIVGGRRRKLPGRTRLISAILTVLIPPAAIIGALFATGDAFLIAGWGLVTIAMFAVGILVAFLTEFIARRGS